MLPLFFNKVETFGWLNTIIYKKMMKIRLRDIKLKISWWEVVIVVLIIYLLTTNDLQSVIKVINFLK